MRVLLVGAAAILVVACSNGDDSADTTLPEITLLTTTTEAPIFETETTIATIQTEDGSTTTTTAAPTTTSTTTTVPPSTTEPPATTEPPPASPFTIRPDGIGAATFGAAPDGVIDFVSSVLGGPTSDTGWIDPFDIGPCPGTQIRQVGWGTLLLEFGDVSSIADGRQHFYGYYYGDGTATAVPPGIATNDGLTVGSTVADLLGTDPGIELFSGDEFLGPNFLVNDALRGTLTGLADTDVITSFVGGLPCNG